MVSRANVPKEREPIWKPYCLYDLALEIMQCCFNHNLFVETVLKAYLRSMGKEKYLLPPFDATMARFGKGEVELKISEGSFLKNKI